MSKPAAQPQAIAQTPGADEKMSGVFRLESAAAQTPDPSQIQFTAPPSRRISTQIIALAGVLVLGGGMLYAMRLVGIGPLKDFATAKVPEYDMSQVGVNKTADHKRILDELTANYTKAQVPLDKVQRNPFRMPDGMSKVDEKAAAEDPALASETAKLRAAEARKQKIKSTLAGLELNGVLGGSNPVARISGEAVRVGDTVSEVFTVKAINSRSVELESEDGEVYTIDMHDDDMNATKKPGKGKASTGDKKKK